MAAPHWHFADFWLDPATVSLWHGTEAVALAPKVFDVLAYLVTHPDRLVTKAELLDAVWPETAVTDAVVRVAIGTLRKALGDTARTPRFIATVARRGYRFLAPATLMDMPETVHHARVEPAPAHQRSEPPMPDVWVTQEGEDIWRCAVCQHLQSRAARFCGVCGAPHVEICHACGQVVSRPATFCSGCGQRLVARSDAAPLTPALSLSLADKVHVSRHTRQDKRGAPLITQGLGRHRLALLLAFLLVIEHGDRLGRQLL